MRKKPPPPGPAATRSPFRLSIVVAALFLCATADERFFGVISDEQQMLSMACAIATTGEVGISRGFIQKTDRPGGDAASWYGLGQPLVEVPAMLLAGPWERLFGSRSSQTLFVLTQIGLVLLAASAAGRLARAAGAPPAGEVVAVLGTAVSSPLVTYASSGLSEPLQAAALAGAMAAAALAVRGGGARSNRLAVFSGFLAGAAVLAKVTNLAVAPFTLLPLLLDRTEPGGRTSPRRALLAAAGATPALALWVGGEVSRFGGLFRTYDRDGFCHPILDGAWRLLVGPNEGLLLYFPLSIAAFFGIVVLSRRPGTRGIGLGTAGVLGVLLVTSARWWWWDGTVGFGPRLLVPAMPLLAAAAGVALPALGAARIASWALFAAGVGLNAVGLLQNSAVTTLLIERSSPVALTAEEKARLPKIVLRSASPRTGRFPRSLFKGDDPDFASLRLHAKLLAIRWRTAEGRQREEALRGFPWSPRHPPLEHEIASSAPGTPFYAAERDLLGPHRWPSLFRALTASAQDRTFDFNAAWQQALADQVTRALDMGRALRAERLASRLWSASPTSGAAALYAESLRLVPRHEEAGRFLNSLPERIRTAPSVLVVRALLARDEGSQVLAEALLAGAARGLRTPGIEDALSKPPAEWPATYRALIEGPSADRP
ncbi:MAG: hypothetical protein ACHQPI_12075 [Thermoanaerobaculia bacterium]